MNINKNPFLYRKPRIWLIVAILLGACVLAVVIPLLLIRVYRQNAGSANASAGTGPQSFTVGTNALVTVKEQSGNISVYPGNTNAITITPRNHGTLVAPDPHTVRLLYTHTYTARGNDQITVTTDPWLSNTDFYITIPRTTAVQITLNSGSIDMHAGNGLVANTGSGSIAFDNIQGSVNVHTDSGDVTGNAIVGPVTISAASGSIRLQQITGQVNAKTWSGDVIIHTSAISGDSFLQTESGSVRFDGSIDSHGSYRMQTESGDVDLTLPANAAFLLDASTGSGTVQNDFGNGAVGSAPRAPLALHTQNGSIAIVKA